MNVALLKQIADDLNIVRFSAESFESYANRVLYSSFSLWLKIICLDGITQKSQVNYNISKYYHHKRGEFILNNLLDFFSSNKAWFCCDETNHPVNFLRKRLIFSSDILEINDDSRLYLHKKEYKIVNDTLEKVLGVPSGDFNFSSGISLLRINNNHTYETSKSYIKKFYDDYISNITFVKNEWSESKEYFNPFIETDTIYQCWTELKPKSNIYISRIKDKSGRSLYFAGKNVNQIEYSYKINDFIIESGILNKMLLYIRHTSGNPIRVEIKREAEFFTLRRSVKNFYGEEEIFIQTFGWPEKSLYDQLNWIFPICFYDDVINILNNLFLIVKEV